MRYTLRQVEVFLAVAKHQNVTRAADELAMSQSAASGALKELEAQFDTRLFDHLAISPCCAGLCNARRAAWHRGCRRAPGETRSRGRLRRDLPVSRHLRAYPRFHRYDQRASCTKRRRYHVG